MIDLLIGGILALIMFGIGLSLRAESFQRLFADPRVLLLGLFLQLIWLPVIAFSVSGLLGLSPAFATGVIILAACPGGLTSNFISYLLKANSTLAVSLTICNTTLSLLTVPIIVNLGLNTFWTGEGIAQLPVLPTVVRIFVVVLIPVLIGMGLRARRPAVARYWQPRLRVVSVLLLALLFTLKLFAPAEVGGSNLLLSEVAAILPASLLVNVGALASGGLFGRLAGFGIDDRLTLGVEAGMQNTSLAFLIASTFLANEQMLKPSLVYAMFTFFTGLAYGLLLKPRMGEVLRREFIDGWWARRRAGREQ